MTYDINVQHVEIHININKAFIHTDGFVAEKNRNLDVHIVRKNVLFGVIYNNTC